MLYYALQGGAAMHIPENLRIPVIVFTLEAVLLLGCSLVFFVLVPG
jgi:hypothetical protein